MTIQMAQLLIHCTNLVQSVLWITCPWWWLAQEDSGRQPKRTTCRLWCPTNPPQSIHLLPVNNINHLVFDEDENLAVLVYWWLLDLTAQKVLNHINESTNCLRNSAYSFWFRIPFTFCDGFFFFDNRLPYSTNSYVINNNLSVVNDEAKLPLVSELENWNHDH